MRYPPRVWFVSFCCARPIVRVAALALVMCLGSAGALESRQAGPPAAPVVVVADYDGIVHPVATEFVEDLLARARQLDATLALLVLRTPGGLLDATRAIISRMIESPVPVAVFVAPSGARAASAGFLITIAADVAAMAPGTHIGAAHPVPSGGEGGQSPVMAEKAAADTAAYARTLADARQRNATLAAAAVMESRAFTEREAATASPPLIDVIAPTVEELLRELDGREIRRFDGRTVTLRTAGARIERVTPTWRQTVLGAIAHPQVAYLLLTLGMLGLVVEFWNPGFVLPGVAGGLCLLLAFFAFQVLPINLAGVLLLVFGLALLGAELMVPSFGVLGIGGIIALLAGSLMVTREVPDVRVGLGAILPVVVAAAVVMLGLGRLALRARQLPSSVGLESLIGSRGEAITALGPQQPGQMRVHGEIWRAISDTPVGAGQRLRVVSASGLTLHVQPDGSDPPGGLP